MTTARDRALSILELLAREARGLPMTEIADRLSIPCTGCWPTCEKRAM